MIKEVPVKEEHKHALSLYESKLKEYTEKAAKANEYMTSLSQVATLLSQATNDARKSDIPFDEFMYLRASQSLGYILDEIRKAEQEAVLCQSVVLSLREALTLFLTSAYSINSVSESWQLDTDQGVLFYDSNEA